MVAGEGGEEGVCGDHVSDLALDCKIRKETTQRSRRHELKHVTTLVFQFLCQQNLPSKDSYVFKVPE